MVFPDVIQRQKKKKRKRKECLERYRRTRKGRQFVLSGKGGLGGRNAELTSAFNLGQKRNTGKAHGRELSSSTGPNRVGANMSKRKLDRAVN